ncbi:MAG: HEAT repeat domain-containing protein [Candidatus Eremiobacterota bacterium]
MVCSKCGLNNRDGANFCDGCGKPLGQGPTDEVKGLALVEGSTLNGRYIIKNLIKVGGMGAVYKAEDRVTGKLCAAKELWTYWATSDQEKEYLIKKFESEADLLHQLNHISLPGVIDYFIANERYYILMDFIEGCDLDTLIQEQGNPGLPQEDVVKWAIQIAEVLDYLHNSDPPIIYRDLKPANIMLKNSDGRIVLIDFGIACALQDGSGGSPRTMIGTMGYMSPEQFIGKVAPTSDIFSLGATLYYLLTGTTQELFNYKPMNNIVPGINDALDDIIRRSLQFKPGDRFQSAGEMGIALEQAMRQHFLVTKRLSEVDLWMNQLCSLKDDKSKLEAINRLGELGDRRSSTILADIVLDDNNPILRQAGVYALGKIKDPTSIYALMKKLKDQNNDVCLAAIKSLSNFKEKKALHSLIECLKSENVNIRKGAAIALGKMENPDALDSLIAARNKEGFFSIGMKSIFNKSIEKIKAAKARVSAGGEEDIDGSEIYDLFGVPSKPSSKASDYDTQTLPGGITSDIIFKDKDTIELEEEGLAEQEGFEYKHVDRIYLNLIKELLEKDFTALIPAIQMNRQKLDARFFEILDYEVQSAENDSKLANDLYYLNSIMSNLRIRDAKVPLYVPVAGELEALKMVHLGIDKKKQPEETYTEDSSASISDTSSLVFSARKFPAIQQEEEVTQPVNTPSVIVSSDDILTKKDLEVSYDKKQENAEYDDKIQRKIINYKNMFIDNPDNFEQVISGYKKLKKSSPHNEYVVDGLAWVYMKKGFLKKAFNELITLLEPGAINENSSCKKYFDR